MSNFSECTEGRLRCCGSLYGASDQTPHWDHTVCLQTLTPSDALMEWDRMDERIECQSGNSMSKNPETSKETGTLRAWQRAGKGPQRRVDSFDCRTENTERAFPFKKKKNVQSADSLKF